MTALPPAPRPSFYAYVVTDTSSEPPTPAAVKLTRREAREFIRWDKRADALRIRRARVTIYER